MINVTCALIEYKDELLCAQRSEHMHLPLKWEFPGGKLEPGEQLEHCLKREIKEELGITIELLEALPSNLHSYGTKTIELHPFRCKIVEGTPLPKEHRELRWLKKEELALLDWAAADIPIVVHYLNQF